MKKIKMVTVKTKMIAKKTKRKNKKLMVVPVGVILGIIFIWTLWANTAIGVNHIEVYSQRLPEEFKGFRIAHISDLHNGEFGQDNGDLIEKLRKINPHMIAITGDLIDSSKTDIELALSFVRQAAEIGPTYYVTGNHEAWIDREDYSYMEEELIKASVTVLRNEAIIIERDGAEIEIIGVDDPEFTEKNPYESGFNMILAENITEISDFQGFRILLSHRPEHFDQYVRAGVDLVLSGHAHGGQVRLPFIGGLVAPDQGFMPKYDGGLYKEEDTSMVVSRGLGNSIVPIRINNRPEIVVVELR